MKKRNLFVLTFFIFIYALPAYSNTPIWTVEKNGHQLIIGGTIHLLTPTDYPLPTAFQKAYEQSEQLVFESDIQKIQDPAFQLAMMNELIYTDGRNISSVLSKETYQALETYCASRGIPIAILMNFKPGMVAITLTMMELQRLGIMGTGVDAFFSAKALQDNKQLGQFETAEQQLSFISSRVVPGAPFVVTAIVVGSISSAIGGKFSFLKYAMATRISLKAGSLASAV